MTTPVNGPDDVKPGDLVRVSGRDRFGVASVAKVADAGLTVRFLDGAHAGKTSTLAYEWKRGYETGGRWSVRKSEAMRTFERLTAHVRWWHARPVTPDVSCVSISVPYKERRADGAIGHMESGNGALNDVIRDRPDDVCAQIRALSEWLRAEPSKEAP